MRVVTLLHKLILLICLFILSILLIDTFFLVPNKTKTEHLLSKSSKSETLRYTIAFTYFIQTKTTSFEVNEFVYRNISDSQIIISTTSKLISVPLRVSIKIRNLWYDYNVGYVNAHFGKFVVPALFIIILLFLLRFRDSYISTGICNFTYVCLIFTLAQVYFYLTN